MPDRRFTPRLGTMSSEDAIIYAVVAAVSLLVIVILILLLF